MAQWFEMFNHFRDTASNNNNLLYIFRCYNAIMEYSLSTWNSGGVVLGSSCPATATHIVGRTAELTSKMFPPNPRVQLDRAPSLLPFQSSHPDPGSQPPGRAQNVPVRKGQ